MADKNPWKFEFNSKPTYKWEEEEEEKKTSL